MASIACIRKGFSYAKRNLPKNVDMPVVAASGVNRIEAGIPFCVFWWKSQVCEVKNTTSGSSTKIKLLYTFGNAKENNVDEYI